MDNWDAVLMVQHIKALAIAMMAAAEGLMRPFCRVHGYHSSNFGPPTDSSDMCLIHTPSKRGLDLMHLLLHSMEQRSMTLSALSNSACEQ